MKKLMLAAALALAVVPSALAGGPVPSLTPAATHRLWLTDIARARASRGRSLADASCRPARAIFYAQTDWLRVATTLAANPSPCAQYYVSVPPLAADKTQARAGQAAQIDALGANIHALDEISWNGWNAWVAAGNGSWYDAGVLARQRMAAAGFSTASGDTWALNELSSAVRAGTGTARANALAFMQGLASDGVKGVVFVEGVGQTGDLGTYKANLQGWLGDDGFWSAAAQYASDWAQEDYGDVRAYAVAGSTPQQRRDAEVAYLAHELALANANPNQSAASRSFLDSSYVAFGNAAWAWSSAYGYTAAPVETMEDFVSGQVYADRSLGAPSGVDRLGFAWAPSNTLGLSSGDYTAQTAAVLQRIAAAIHDTGVPAADPGAAACAPSYCATAVAGAAFATAWQGFSAWSLPSVGFTSAPATIVAGGTTPLTLAVSTAGVPQVSVADQPVSLSTTSAKGGFSTSATGPFTPTLTVSIPAGQPSATVYYSDALAGSATVSAALAGQAPATQAVAVAAGPLATLVVTPASATVAAGKTVALNVAGSDAYGNAAAITPAWTLAPAAAGTLSASTGAAVVFKAGAKAGQATVSVSSGTVAATARLVVTKPAPHVGKVSTKTVHGHLVVTALVLRGTTPGAGVPLRLTVRKGSSVVAVVNGSTTGKGTLTWRSRSKLPRARYVARAVIRTASTASRTQQPAR